MRSLTISILKKVKKWKKWISLRFNVTIERELNAKIMIVQRKHNVFHRAVLLNC